jgi:hypothetical protein
MRKLFLCAAVAVFAFTSVNAQEVKFGVKAGVNFASVGGDDTDDLDGRTSFHFGGVAEIVISDKFSVQPELVYSAQGAKASFEEDSFKEEVTTKLDYLNIPIMAKYYVAEGFSIEAGPQIGILMKAEAEFDFTDSEFPEDNESGTEDLKDGTSGIDFGFGIGAGYKMDSGLNFALRYNLGLSNINDFEGSDDFSNNNNVLQVSVGYMF